MKLVNISNKERTIYLFCRDDRGILSIKKDGGFFPFFYEPDQRGPFKSYDGVPLRRVFAPKPSDIPKMRSLASYSSDIPFVKNYLIHKVDKIEKCPIKYCFVDIEIMAKDMPNVDNPIHPISTISLYNSFTKEIKNWSLLNYVGNTEEKERQLLEDFVNYMQKECFDLFFSWNVDFDYNYLHNRYKKFTRYSFAKAISPVKQLRSSRIDNVFYPAGISILDYLSLFKKVFMREASYTLDYIASKYLGAGKEYKDVDFSKIDDVVVKRNMEDVKLLAKLEEKYQLIDYYDEIRRLTKCLWEDLYHNSLIVEMLLFEEAKKKKIVLPNVPKTNTKEDFAGAIREAKVKGVLSDISKFDLTSAYPSCILDFCLDSQNINNKEGVEINGVKFRQNRDALLPSAVAKMLSLKDKLKKELKNMQPNTEEYKTTKIQYAAVKGIVNSMFGVFGFERFRLYNPIVASTITFLVRDLLSYVIDNIEKQGYKVVYFDTDGIMIKTKENISDKLNELIKKWGREKYNKDDINIEFDFEGIFDKIFILAKCRYVGYLRTDKGVEKEIKGVEIKRSNSSKYEAWFQDTLIEMFFEGKSKDEIIEWVLQQKREIKNKPLIDIAFPCKIADRDYKNEPIFIRAYNNTQNIVPDFKVNKGEIFYYIYVKSNDPNRNVLAFTEDYQDFINREQIDWDEMIRRNIITKAENIFKAVKGSVLEITKNQKALF